MVDGLIKLFVKEEDHGRKRIKTGVLCGYINAGCNIMLFLFKLVVGTMSGSIAVTADAFNNLSDTFSSAVTIIGFNISHRKPDKKHPSGYGRFEYVAGVVVSVLVIMVGIEFIRNSIAKIIAPEEVEANYFMAAVLVGAILVKVWMCYANIKFSNAMGGSSALKATAIDSVSDMGATTIALLSLVLSRYSGFPVDGCLGLVVALVVIAAGIKVLLDTISPLLGQSASPELVEKIHDLMMEYEDISGVHDIIIHNYGPMKMIATAHVEVSVDSDIIIIHEIIDQAEREIGELLGINIITHLDPIITDDETVNKTKELVEEKLKEINQQYEMHDFRIIDDNAKVCLVFDVMVPYGLNKSDEEIEKEISQKLKETDSGYCMMLTIDKNFVGE